MKFFTELQERIKFWYNLKHNRKRIPFWYNKENSSHIAADSYSILTDKVSYRKGRFGECGFPPYPTMLRTRFLNLCNEGFEKK